MKKVLLIGVLVLVAGLILIAGGVTFLQEEVAEQRYFQNNVRYIVDAHTEPNIPATVAGIIVLVAGGCLIFASRGTSPKLQ